MRESDELALSLTADLDRLAGWAGARFHLSFSMRSGTSLSDRDIGNVFTVAQVCCGHTYRLVNVALEQSLFDDRVSLRGGRIAAGDEFLASPLYGNFVQEAFNGNPMGIALQCADHGGSDGDVGDAGPRAAHPPALPDGGRVQRRPHARRQ